MPSSSGKSFRLSPNAIKIQTAACRSSTSTNKLKQSANNFPESY